MWKAPASVLCGCLAALPLIGCAGNVGTSAQATAMMPAAITEPAPNYIAVPRVTPSARWRRLRFSCCGRATIPWRAIPVYGRRKGLMS
jgi:hypothetical protein